MEKIRPARCIEGANERTREIANTQSETEKRAGSSFRRHEPRGTVVTTAFDDGNDDYNEDASRMDPKAFLFFSLSLSFVSAILSPPPPSFSTSSSFSLLFSPFLSQLLLFFPFSPSLLSVRLIRTTFVRLRWTKKCAL